MNVDERRNKILRALQSSDKPIAAKTLAEQFGVSRQVIVNDIAVIRAAGNEILSNNHGYIILSKPEQHIREFKVRHTAQQAELEMNTIVDCGGWIKNVSISHRVYGRISAQMHICSRQDVQEFLDKIEDAASDLLGCATSGYHYHVVEAGSEERLDLIEQRLREAGILAPLQPWEHNKNT